MQVHVPQLLLHVRCQGPLFTAHEGVNNRFIWTCLVTAHTASDLCYFRHSEPVSHTRDHISQKPHVASIPTTSATHNIRSKPATHLAARSPTMGRMTRAKAAEVAEKLHIDEDDVLQLQSSDRLIGVKNVNSTPDRSPLGQIAPNSGSNKSGEEDESVSLKKSTRSTKAGKKGAANGKTNGLAASTASPPDIVGESPEVVVDAREAVSSPASDKAAEELMQDEHEGEFNTLDIIIIIIIAALKVT